MSQAESAVRALADYNPFDPAVMEDPWDYYRKLRSEGPVYRDSHTGMVMVSTYEAVAEALRDYERFSNRFGVGMGGVSSDPELSEVMREGYRPVDTMLTADPPEHKRFRGLVNKAFTPRRVNALESEMQKIADELLARFGSVGRFEVLSEFSVPLTLTVISDQLGVPRKDLARFKRWTDGFTTQLSGMASHDEQLEAAKRIIEFQNYFAERLAEVRDAPRDDIISALVRARIEGERPLDTAESLSILQQLLVAGNETTASAVAEGLLLLIRHPEQLEQVRADPDLIPNLTEEVLRLATPTQNMFRVATEDCELGGVSIAKGNMLFLRFGCANRDPDKFEDPERFDIHRENADEHLAFGHGIHFCIGAILARKEMLVAFRTLLPQLRGLRLAPGAELVHKPNVLLRGLRELPLEFEPI